MIHTANAFGVDEVGRGALAGPVCACAIAIKPDCAQLLTEVKDSKKLSSNVRTKLYDLILGSAIDYQVNFVDPHVIDDINILNATMLCMKNAVMELKVTPKLVLIDGNVLPPGIPYPKTAIIKGDQTQLSIACASIVAKVTRDKFMTQVLDVKYPEYGFAKHKGYATEKHVAMIRKYGRIPQVHRFSFKIPGE